MNESERLARIERRLVAIEDAINVNTDAANATNVMIARIDDWLHRPPSNDLANALAQILAGVTETRQMMVELHQAALGERR